MQAQAAPVLLEGRDAFVVAPTGGGKTGSFLVPALHLVIASRGSRKTLIAAPTRELVAQLAREARRWLGLCGSDLVVATPPFTDSKAALYVATPQALLQCNIKPALLVLDEADRLLDTEGGLLKAVDALLAKGGDARARVGDGAGPVHGGRRGRARSIQMRRARRHRVRRTARPPWRSASCTRATTTAARRPRCAS